MGITIRKYVSGDLNAMTAIWNSVVVEGTFFPQVDTMGLDEASDFFSQQSYTGVADDNGEVVGLYILHPNNIGRCGHIANASYAVKPGQRGKHIGEGLVLDSMQAAKALLFRLLQFNAVVATNANAIHLYTKLGFTQLGTIPGGFKLNDNSYADIILFYISLIS